MDVAARSEFALLHDSLGECARLLGRRRLAGRAVTEHSDEYILGRLIERVRLLVAISDEIPVETKLQVQGMLKMFEAEVLRPEDEHDRAQVRAWHGRMYDDLEAYPDLEALLGAMRNFIAYL